MKRFVMIVIAVMLMVPGNFIIAGADAEAQNPIIANFTDAAAVSKVANLTASDEKRLYSPISAKWSDSTKSIQFNLSTNNAATDWSCYSHLNFWMYNEVANNAKVNVVCYSNNESSYFMFKLRLDFSGWKLISLPLNKSPKGAISGTVDITSMKSVTLSLSGWSDTEYDSYADLADEVKKPIYFDRMWLSNNDDSVLEVKNFYNADTVSTNDNVAFNGSTTKETGLVFDTTVKNTYSGSAKWDNSTAKKTARSYVGPYFAKNAYCDVSSAKVLNQLMYSPSASGETVSVALYCNKSVNGTMTSSTTSTFTYTFNIDWTGWKVVSIPLSSGVAVNDPSLLYPKDVQYTVSAVGPVLYFDRIWFSSAETAPDFDIGEDSVKAGAQNVAVTDRVISFPYTARVADNQDASKITVSKKTDGVVTNVTGFTVYGEGNNLNVVLNDDLDFKSEYTVSVNSGIRGSLEQVSQTGGSAVFTTEAGPDYTVSPISLSHDETNVTATSDVTINVEGDRHFVILLVSYKANTLEHVNVVKYDKTTTDSFTMTATLPIAGNEGCTFKAYIWDENIAPLTNVEDLAL